MMTFNSADNLKKTLKSVEMQDYPNIEVVISDAASKDSTVDVIKEYEKTTRYEINWVSEPDKGLYNGLNKSVSRATGDYLLVCNDQLVSDKAVSKLVKALEDGNNDGSHCDLIYADDSEVKRYWHMGNGKLSLGWMPGHPTLLLKKEVYEKYGMYREDTKIAADYDFMIRILKDKKVKLGYVPEILVRMYYGGTSTDSAGSYMDSFKEGVDAMKNNGVKGAFLANCFRTLRVVGQFIFKKSAVKMWAEYEGK